MSRFDDAGPSGNDAAWSEDTVRAALDTGGATAAGRDAQESEVNELRALGASCRAAFDLDGSSSSEADAFQSSRVAQRVLEQTTGVRAPSAMGERTGDRTGYLTGEHAGHEVARPVLAFVSDRLRASWLIRVAAALLVVQLTLVPLVAYHLLSKERPSSLYFDFEKGAEELRAELADDLPEPDLEVEGGSASAMDDVLDDLLADDELAVTRVTLDAVRGDLALTSSGSIATTSLGRALRDLTIASSSPQALAGAARSGWSEDADASLLVRTLRTEARLFAFDAGGSYAGIASDLERLSAQLVSQDAAGVDARSSRLAHCALAHARRAGLALPELSAEELPVNDLSAWGLDAGALWIETLESALRRTPEASEDPYVAAWLQSILRVR